MNKTLPTQKALTSVGSAAFNEGAGRMSAPGPVDSSTGTGAQKIPHAQRQVRDVPQRHATGDIRLPQGTTHKFHDQLGAGPSISSHTAGVPAR